MSRTPREYVFIELPRIACPNCGVSDYLGEPRSIRQVRAAADPGDGSRRRTMLCSVCGETFYLVLEKV